MLEVEHMENGVRPTVEVDEGNSDTLNYPPSGAIQPVKHAEEADAALDCSTHHETSNHQGSAGEEAPSEEAIPADPKPAQQGSADYPPFPEQRYAPPLAIDIRPAHPDSPSLLEHSGQAIQIVPPLYPPYNPDPSPQAACTHYGDDPRQWQATPAELGSEPPTHYPPHPRSALLPPHPAAPYLPPPHAPYPPYYPPYAPPCYPPHHPPPYYPPPFPPHPLLEHHHHHHHLHHHHHPHAHPLSQDDSQPHEGSQPEHEGSSEQQEEEEEEEEQQNQRQQRKRKQRQQQEEEVMRKLARFEQRMQQLQQQNDQFHDELNRLRSRKKAAAPAELPPEILPLLAAATTTSKRNRGGRQPGKDPRLDPNIDPKKARRIIANRESAARSKMRQKLLLESLKAQQELLKLQIQMEREQATAQQQQQQQLEEPPAPPPPPPQQQQAAAPRLDLGASLRRFHKDRATYCAQQDPGVLQYTDSVTGQLYFAQLYGDVAAAVAAGRWPLLRFSGATEEENKLLSMIRTYGWLSAVAGKFGCEGDLAEMKQREKEEHQKLKALIAAVEQQQQGKEEEGAAAGAAAGVAVVVPGAVGSLVAQLHVPAGSAASSSSAAGYSRAGGAAAAAAAAAAARNAMLSKRVVYGLKAE